MLLSNAVELLIFSRRERVLCLKAGRPEVLDVVASLQRLRVRVLLGQEGSGPVRLDAEEGQDAARYLCDQVAIAEAGATLERKRDVVCKALVSTRSFDGWIDERR